MRPPKRGALRAAARRAFLRPFSRPIAGSDLVADILADVLTGFVLLLVGGILISNSTYQFSLFTKLRNAFADPKAAYGRIANIRAVVLDDETNLLLNEGDFPGGVYDAIAESVRSINDYAKTAEGRRVVVGVDYVLNSVKEDRELDALASALSDLEPNVFVAFGGALSQAGTETGYFRADVFRDRLAARLRKSKGDEYVDRHFFIGNLHILKGAAVSGFQELEDTDIALGYVPVFDQAGVAYYSLPFMMYMLGEVVPSDSLGSDGFCISSQGYVRYDFDPDPALVPATGKKIADFSNRPLRYNFRSPDDLAEAPLGMYNYYPLTRVSSRFNTDGGGAKSLREAIDVNEFPLSQQGVEAAGKSKADYFLVYRTKSLGYIDDDVSADVVVTPASGRDPFTNDIRVVSGAMTHLVALSNLIWGEYIVEVPGAAVSAVSIVLGLLCLYIGLRCEFRTILLSGAAFTILTAAAAYAFFLRGVFFPCKLPLGLIIGILLGFGAIRFLAGKKDCE